MRGGANCFFFFRKKVLNFKVIYSKKMGGFTKQKLESYFTTNGEGKVDLKEVLEDLFGGKWREPREISQLSTIGSSII